MDRRLKMRRQIALLLIAMRIAYGGSLLVIFWVNSRTAGSLLNYLHEQGNGSVHILFTALTFSACALIVDGLLDTLWPYLSAKHTEQRWRHCRWLSVSWLYRLRRLLTRACGMANRHRHWFYLPPAFAALFVVPSAVYLGAQNITAVQWLWLWLFACGIGAALVEGAINNERVRYAQ